MGILSLLEVGVILLLLGTVAFIVIAIPLFYTVVTRWAFSGGAPVSAAPRTIARTPAPTPASEPAPAPAPAPAPEAKAVKPAEASTPKGGRRDAKLGLIYDAAPDAADDLTKIKGVAKVLEEKLHGVGVYTYAQIVEWDDAQIDAFSKLLAFKERIRRDDWQGQCRKLMGG